MPYQPRDPKRYRPAIALIGCGGMGEVWQATDLVIGRNPAGAGLVEVKAARGRRLSG